MRKTAFIASAAALALMIAGAWAASSMRADSVAQPHATAQGIAVTAASAGLDIVGQDSLGGGLQSVVDLQAADLH